MNGQMKKYKETLKDMPEPILLSQMTKTMNLRGLLKYAQDKRVKVCELTEKERMSFVRDL